jgi:hypothetical protein
MIKLDMSESDIVRAIKNSTKSPLEYLASRHFKQDVRDVDSSKDGIIIWEYDADDYISYRYCEEDISKIDKFVDEWEEFANEEINNFDLEPISFCVYRNG